MNIKYCMLAKLYYVRCTCLYNIGNCQLEETMTIQYLHISFFLYGKRTSLIIVLPHVLRLYDQRKPSCLNCEEIKGIPVYYR